MQHRATHTMHVIHATNNQTIKQINKQTYKRNNQTKQNAVEVQQCIWTEKQMDVHGSKNRARLDQSLHLQSVPSSVGCHL